MLLEQAADSLRIEVPPRQAPGVEQEILDPRAELTAKPGADRDPKALLAAPHQVRRQATPARDLLHSPLYRSAWQLHLAWQPGRELVDAIVKEGGPPLQGVGHRHSVHLEQQVARQICLGVKRQVPIDS